jgi:hypothetical protein
MLGGKKKNTLMYVSAYTNLVDGRRKVKFICWWKFLVVIYIIIIIIIINRNVLAIYSGKLSTLKDFTLTIVIF